MRLWLSDILQKCLDFSNILNASITASWLILAVLCLRLFLKKAPKWTHVALWGLVALRLLLPFPIESVFSLIPSTETLPSEILAYGPVRHAEAARLDIVTNPIFAEPVCVELPQTVGRVQGITMNWTFCGWAVWPSWVCIRSSPIGGCGTGFGRQSGFGKTFISAAVSPLPSFWAYSVRKYFCPASCRNRISPTSSPTKKPISAERTTGGNRLAFFC